MILFKAFSYFSHRRAHTTANNSASKGSDGRAQWSRKSRPRGASGRGSHCRADVQARYVFANISGTLEVVIGIEFIEDFDDRSRILNVMHGNQNFAQSGGAIERKH